MLTIQKDYRPHITFTTINNYKGTPFNQKDTKIVLSSVFRLTYDKNMFSIIFCSVILSVPCIFCKDSVFFKRVVALCI